MQRALPRNGGGAPPADDSSNPLGPIEATLSCLWIVTPLTATISLLVVIVAMFTNQWLHTEEKMNNPSYNGTGEKDYLSKLTISGLWIFCFTDPGETLYDCNKIDYFSKEEYNPDPNDSTMAIPYTVTRSAMFFLASTFLLCGGYCCSLLGQCVRHRTLYTFISGVIFIVTGLVMLLGLIMYISVFKSEIGSKLRPRSQLQAPLFDYSYGYSFLLYVFGLVSTQLAGISSIFLFIYKLQYDYHYKRLKHAKRGAKPPPRPPPLLHYDPALFYPCRRHPQAYINSNTAIHVPPPPPSQLLNHQKRYFFSKEPLQESPCSVHRLRPPSHSNSLKDVSSFYDFPPPPTISYQFDERYGREGPGGRLMPRDLTTNTMSTTADVNCDDFMGGDEGEVEYSPPPPHEFVSFDVERGGMRKCNSFDSDTLRRTTPV